MNLQEIVDALAPLVDSKNHDVVGKADRILLTYEEYRAVVRVVEMLNLANYKQDQSTHPRLVAALELVLAIADHPDQNPTEDVFLSPKTRAQINSALFNVVSERSIP